MMKRIGLIAGSGQFPILFSEAAHKNGYEIYAAAYQNEADPMLASHVDGIEWLHLGQIRRLIKFFNRFDIHEAVMIGAIRKTRMFTDIKPDIKAIMLIAAMKDTHDDAVLRGFAGLLEKEGITIQPSTFLLPELLATQGCWTRRKPSRAENTDIETGWRLAKEIGKLGIGQCIVIGQGSVLAVEAIDGTDATILRGGKLGRGNAVVVKVCKPNQDTRFDIPAVGMDTIKAMKEAGVTAIAIEAGKAVVFNREEMTALADQSGISIVALS